MAHGNHLDWPIHKDDYQVRKGKRSHVKTLSRGTQYLLLAVFCSSLLSPTRAINFAWRDLLPQQPLRSKSLVPWEECGAISGHRVECGHNYKLQIAASL